MGWWRPYSCLHIRIQCFVNACLLLLVHTYTKYVLEWNWIELHWNGCRRVYPLSYGLMTTIFLLTRTYTMFCQCMLIAACSYIRILVCWGERCVYPSNYRVMLRFPLSFGSVWYMSALSAPVLFQFVICLVWCCASRLLLLLAGSKIGDI